jgi:hypothetical protein
MLRILRPGVRQLALVSLILTFVLACKTVHAEEDRNAIGNPPAMAGPTVTVDPLRPGASIKLIGYGDTRFTDPSNTTATNPRMRRFLVDRITEEAPDALFETGDLAYIGSHPADWAEFREETAAWSSLPMRVFPTIGNHEVIDDFTSGVQNYLAAFPELKGCRYYSVLIGNVYLLSLDQYLPTGPGSRERQWVVEQLEHLPPQVNFVFVLNHQPLVNDLQSEVAVGLPEAKQTDMRILLEREQARVGRTFIILSGHIHNYERYRRGPMNYVITGGGGAKPYHIFVRGPEDLYRDTSFPVFNYVVFEVKGKHIDATMYRVHDPSGPAPKMEVGDRFTLDAAPAK